MKVAGIAFFFFLFVITGWAQDEQQDPSSAGQNSPSAHPSAITYSNGYQTRAKIHKIASFATLPLFATELALGESLYRNPNSADTERGLHAAVGTGIVGLFGLNTVTGVWNMVEDRHNPEGHTLRLIHGILMMTANAGFVATAATGPHREGRHTANVTYSSNRALHRDLAFGSIGIGTIGYSLMLFRHH